MAADNNLILVTNESKVADILKPKLVLLREIDDILSISYARAIDKIKSNVPEIVLLYCQDAEKDICIKLIQEIKKEENLKNIPLLLVMEKYNQDFILNAYEESITDYITMENDDAEILIRTIWCLKKSNLVKTLGKQYRLLEKLSVINKNTGCYTDKFCKEIYENEVSTLKEMKTSGMVLLLAPSEESKLKLDMTELAKAIKTSVRSSDTVIHEASNKFYLLLADTQLKGTFCVLEKIKRAIGEQHTLNASISAIGKAKFETVKKELLNGLIEAQSTNQEVVIISENKTPKADDWLDKINSKQKNFKLFKQAFNKKLEKVISPVFFQMQKLYEEKLFETQIEQYSNSTISNFLLKRGDKISELRITYPGFSKINIDILHQGLDSPENRRLSLDLTELSESNLTKVLDDFIVEFKAFTNA